MLNKINEINETNVSTVTINIFTYVLPVKVLDIFKFFKQHYFVLIDFQSLYSKSVLIFVTSSFPEIGCSENSKE